MTTNGNMGVCVGGYLWSKDTQKWLHHRKVHPNQGDNTGKLQPWSSLKDTQAVGQSENLSSL